MMQWTIAFLVIAFVAAIFGFTGIAGTAAWIAKTLFFMAIVLFVLGMIAQLVRRR
jgi:uncharacterized membrane protein YtjA (UPF0391 family)